MKKCAGSLLLLLTLLCANSGMSVWEPTKLVSTAAVFVLEAGLGGAREESGEIRALTPLLAMNLPLFSEYETPDVEIDPQRGETKIEIGFELRAWEEAEAYHEGEPLVLIYHTHTTEAYMRTENPESYRSSEPADGVVAAGSLTAKILHDEFGIEVLYVSEILDSTYDAAYDRSEMVIKAATEAYPSIKYIFDIHRDGLSDTAANRELYAVDIDGARCARIMLVVGGGSRFHEENAAFADSLKRQMEQLYPGLYRRTITKNGHFNQQYSPYSMLFELGSNLTTPEEARRTGVYLGRVLGTIIKPTQ